MVVLNREGSGGRGIAFLTFLGVLCSRLSWYWVMKVLSGGEIVVF